MTVRCTVWGENVHEHESEVVASIYPNGMHEAIASALNADGSITATTVTLQEPEHGCSEAKLDETDVLVWWGHAAHEAVADRVVDRLTRHIWAGMGFRTFFQIVYKTDGYAVRAQMARSG
jgi:trehalose utilization protein